MNILINGLALSSRGSYTLAKSFLEDIGKGTHYLESNNISIIFLTTVKHFSLYSSEKVKVIVFPGGLLNRVINEKKEIKKIIHDNKIDKYLSLQNIGFFGLEIPQYVLLHQGLIFEKKDYKLIEMKNIIKYQILMKSLLILQVKKNHINKFFVQTKWMKEEAEKLFGIKTIIIRPKSNLEKLNVENILPTKTTKQKKLFYPTNNEKYKNNQLLIKTFNYLEKNGILTDLHLILTIEGQNTSNITFCGKLTYDQMPKYYMNSDALIFPSAIESLGLPILEAQNFNLKLLLSNSKYAKELLQPETEVIFFETEDISDIVKALECFAKDEFDAFKNENKSTDIKTRYLDYIVEMMD